MNRIGHSVPRLDGISKASGRFRYSADVLVKDALIGKVLRSPLPHAAIKTIDVSRALAQPGVRAVLTYRDMAGPNLFGAIIPDQPVLCRDKVRYEGDAVAVVAADSDEDAEIALEHIDVDYDPLPVITTPQEALSPDAIKVHEKGNLAHRVEYAKGNVQDAFQNADLIISEKYHTSRQKHMYIETEAGFSLPTKKGVDVYVASQVPFQDRLQICRVLSLPQSSVRVIAIDSGGAFGGKEEITVQIHLALLAMKTKKPVRMSWTREESGISATTRHPMDIELKTGFRKDGTLLGNDAHLIADTGAYMSYGPTVIEVAAGAVNGPYKIPCTHVEGLSVYTNNPPAGAMRGFGVAQANFAMETQLDIAAEKLGLDPLGLRKINALKEGETDGTGYVAITKPRLTETLETVEKVDLWKNMALYRGQGERPWLFRGVGFAAGMKSMGYGAFPEQVMVKIKLTHEGGYKVYSSNPEMGSGTSTALKQIAAQALSTLVSKVELAPRDTKYGVDSGGSDASRVVYVIGNAIIKASDNLKKKILKEASRRLRTKAGWLKLTSTAVVGREKHLSLRDLARAKTLAASAWYSVPRPSNPLPGTMSIPNVLFSFAACVANVEVNTLTGQVKVLNLVFVPEVGTVINPQGLEAQSEGGMTQSIGYALMEDLQVEAGKVKTPNFTTYLVPTIEDTSKPLVVPVANMHEPTGPFGAKGAGELSTIAVPAAICNAIHDAVGARVTALPATPERILMGIQAVQNK
ncbi:MAG: molybdopterin cofactor-binding domain-containing protein [Candidatus Bathyarchaeia archaeon]